MNPGTAAAGLVFTLLLGAAVFLAHPGAHARLGAAGWAALGLAVTVWYVAASPGATGAAFVLTAWYLLSAVAAVQGLRTRYRARALQRRAQRAAAAAADPGVTW